MSAETQREIEFKLDVDASEVATVKACLAAAYGPGHGPERLVSAYFDTERHDLHAHGMTLRIRSSGGRRVQTIKASSGARGGLFDRSEWETAVADGMPDLEAAAGTPLAAILRQKRPLSARFETIVERTTWVVKAGGSQVEIAFDEGRVAGQGQSRTFTEIEFELKRGRPADLFPIVRGLEAVSHLGIGVVAKSDRGFTLIDGGERRIHKSTAVPLNPSVPTAEAFQAIMHAGLRQFRLNEPLVIERSADALHQARVAMRRLRAALALFKDRVADDRVGSIKDRLRSVSRQLGEARDLDVYLRDHRAGLATTAKTDDGDAAALLAAAEQRRTRAYDAVIATLRSAAFRRFLIELVEWVEAGPWLVGPDPSRHADGDPSIVAFAAAVLDRRRRQIKRRGRRLDRLSPHERHRVRIAVKTLRYAADFFGSLVQGRKKRHRHAACVDALEAMQLNLGALNDIRTAVDLEDSLDMSTSLTAPVPDDAKTEGGSEKDALDLRIEALLHNSAEAHRAFAKTKRFWRHRPDAPA